MESYAAEVETASGEEAPMALGAATKALKTAGAASIGLQFAGYSAKGKAGQEAAAAAASGAGDAFAMAALATAMAHKAMEMAQQAAAAAVAASKQAEEATQAVEAKHEEEEEEEEAAADATDSEDDDEEDGGMTSLEYIMTYKQLPPHEVELLLEEPVQRVPFADSQLFKDLSADPSATEEDFDDALEEHEERQDMRVRFHDWVRSEYEARGYVAVSDEYIARRARTQEWASKMWKEAFADFGVEDEEGVGAN